MFITFNHCDISCQKYTRPSLVSRSLPSASRGQLVIPLCLLTVALHDNSGEPVNSKLHQQ